MKIECTECTFTRFWDIMLTCLIIRFNIFKKPKWINIFSQEIDAHLVWTWGMPNLFFLQAVCPSYRPMSAWLSLVIAKLPNS